MTTAMAPRRMLDLKAELARREISVTDLADRIGMSRGHLSDILHGRRSMTERTARDVSRATKIPLRLITPEAAGA